MVLDWHLYRPTDTEWVMWSASSLYPSPRRTYPCTHFVRSFFTPTVTRTQFLISDCVIWLFYGNLLTSALCVRHIRLLLTSFFWDDLRVAKSFIFVLAASRSQYPIVKRGSWDELTFSFPHSQRRSSLSSIKVSNSYFWLAFGQLNVRITGLRGKISWRLSNVYSKRRQF